MISACKKWGWDWAYKCFSVGPWLSWNHFWARKINFVIIKGAHRHTIILDTHIETWMECYVWVQKFNAVNCRESAIVYVFFCNFGPFLSFRSWLLRICYNLWKLFMIIRGVEQYPRFGYDLYVYLNYVRSHILFFVIFIVLYEFLKVFWNGSTFYPFCFESMLFIWIDWK